MFHLHKTKTGEKSRFIRKQKDLLDFQFPGFVQQPLDQRSAHTFVRHFRCDGKRAYFRQVFPVNMERAAAEHPVRRRRSPTAML